MPSLAERLFADLPAELAGTRRFLERHPAGHAEWRPHPKSRPLAALATHLAAIPARGAAILTLPGLDAATVPPAPPVDTAAELLALFDAGAAAFQAAVATVADAALDEPWALTRGGQVMIQAPRAMLVRRMGISHLVHHRAQLGTYYRHFDVPLPGVLGPSADE